MFKFYPQRISLIVAILFFTSGLLAQDFETDSIRQEVVIDSLWELFEAHFDDTAIAKAERIIDDLDSIYRTRPTLDSNAIGIFWGHKVNFRGIERDMVGALEAIDSTLAYQPDTPLGNSNRLLYMMLRINYAQTSGATGNIYPDIKRLAYRMALDTVADPSNIVKMYAALGSKVIDLGYYAEGKQYLDAAERIYADIPPEQVMFTSRRSPVLITFLRHLLAVRSQNDTLRMEQVRRMEALYAAEDFTKTEKLTLKFMYARDIGYLIDSRPILDDGLRRQIEAQLAVARALPSDPNKIFIDNNLYRYEAVLAAQAGDLARAEAMTDSLLATVTMTDKDRDLYFYDKVYILTEQGRFAEARPFVDSILVAQHGGDMPLADDYQNFNPTGFAFIKTVLPRAAGRLALSAEPEFRQLAARLYRLALKGTYDNFRATRSSDRFRRRYEPILTGLLALAAGDPAAERATVLEVLQALETFEGGPAWQQFAASRNLRSSTLPDSLREREKELNAAITKARTSNASGEALLTATLALEDFQQQLADTYPRRFARRSPKVDVGALQAALDAQTLLLRYQYLNGRLYRFELDAQRIGYTILPEDIIDASIEFAAGDLMAEALFPTNFEAYKHIEIVPDGPLHRIPFEALRTADGYVVEQHIVSYLPFLSFRQIYQPNDLTSAPLLAIAPRYDMSPPPATLALRDGTVALEGAAAESAYLVDLFGGRMVTDATTAKSAFVNEAPDARLLHLAMHARIDNEQPELSYFDFGGDDQESSRLYVEELYGLNLGADLAVLSACNTGRGKIDDTKGLVSLHRAFTYAGVPATVASLWAVPDAATATLMKSFYERLHAGEPKDAALRGAKLDYLATTTEPALRAPLYWAGFVLYGDTSPVAGGGVAWWWYLLGVGVVLVGGAWLARRV